MTRSPLPVHRRHPPWTTPSRGWCRRGQPHPPAPRARWAL